MSELFPSITSSSKAEVVLDRLERLDKSLQGKKPGEKIDILSKVTDPGLIELLRVIFDETLQPGISVATAFRYIQNNPQEPATPIQFFTHLNKIFNGTYGETLLEEELYLENLQNKLAEAAEACKNSDNKNYRENDEIWYNLKNKVNKAKENINSLKEEINILCAKCQALSPYFSEILQQDLGWRLGAKSLNLALPGTVDILHHQIVDEWEPGMKLTGRWCWQEKFDGERCIIKIVGGRATAYDATGIVYKTLTDACNLISERLTPDINFVLDGEFIKDSGQDHLIDFSELSQEIRRVGYQIPVLSGDFQYQIFDFVPLKDFEAGASNLLLSQRQQLLNKFLEKVNQPFLRAVKSHWFSYKEQNDSSYIQKINSQHFENGKEGLVLKRDSPYKSGYNSDLLKVKSTFFIEAEVVRVSLGERDWGSGVKEEGVNALFFQYKDSVVGTGSGICRDEAVSWKADESLVVGKTIKVMHYGELTQTGSVSLRHPVYKGIVK